MNNKPFIFTESVRYTDSLLTELEYLGLSRNELKEEDQKEIWSMSCPWKLNDKIQLVWERSFCNDGWHEEDKSVHLYINYTEIASLDIAILFKKPLEKPLREVIVKKVKEIVMVYTGKKS